MKIGVLNCQIMGGIGKRQQTGVPKLAAIGGAAPNTSLSTCKAERMKKDVTQMNACVADL